VTEVWERLKQNAAAQLIDVRTRAEWSYVGVPDLSPIGRETVFAEWQTFPDNAVDAAFVDKLTKALAARQAGTSTPLYFICRSGVRSLRAAEAMRAAGFEDCSNVADGFEGPLNPSRHRGTTAGWKAAGLPWIQA
jgi:rhodanese-related sulfurtransferase